MSFILCGQCGQQNTVTASHCSNCDANLPGISSDRADPYVPGTYLDNGPYLIEALLASGKLGRIYQAEDTSGEYEAIALREFTPAIGKPAILEKIVEKIVQRLNAAIIQQPQFVHSQVAKFWQVFAEDDRIFLVGNLLQGKSYKFLLQDRKRQRRCFSEAEIIQLWRQLLPVLNQLHSQGAIHGYIAPENIIHPGGDRLPVLIDFGGIQELAIKLMSPGKFISNLEGNWGNIPRGKLGYAPEEQLRSGIVNPNSDLYALAVTSVVLMTGKPPEKLIDVFTMSWTWHRELNLTPVIKDCLIKMLAPQPGDRFQSATEILNIVESHPDIPLPIIDADETIPESAELPDEPEESAIKPVEVVTETLAEVSTLSTENASDSFITPPPFKPPLDERLPEPKEIEKEIKRWNWGAAILPGFWCLSNQVWFGLFAWGGFFINARAGIVLWIIIGFILGIIGNQLAWKSGKWNNLAHFKTHQRGWGIFVLLVFGSILLLFFFLILVLIFGVL